MKAMKVPNYSWGEEVNQLKILISRVYTRVLVDETQYKKIKKKMPNLETIHIFGCLVYTKQQK